MVFNHRLLCLIWTAEPPLFEPSAARYLNSSPRYKIGGWRRLSHRDLMRALLRSSEALEPLGREAASWIMRSIYMTKPISPVSSFALHLLELKLTRYFLSPIKPSAISPSTMEKIMPRSAEIRVPWLLISASIPLIKPLRVLGWSASRPAADFVKASEAMISDKSTV